MTTRISATAEGDSGALPKRSVEVVDRAEPIEREWRAFEREAAGHVFQTYDWMASWIANVAPTSGVEPRIVVGRGPDGRIEFLLPMGLRRSRGVRILEWLGGEQADYQCGLFAPATLARIGDSAAVFEAFLEPVLEAVGDIDLVHMVRQPETLGGHRNPFLALASYRNASAAHATVLGDDWETYYKSRRASGWRRTDRGKLRRMGEIGQVSYLDGTDPVLRRRILDTLFEQKRAGLAAMGVADIFEPDGVRAFYEDLASRHFPHGPAHLCALQCGDVLVACNFSLAYRDTYYYILHSYALDRFREYSPGRALMYEIMQWSIANGLPRFDFTIGDETYKDRWCEEELGLYDSVAPRTLTGRMAASSYRLSQAVKRTIKNDPRLWTAARYVRARIGGG